MLKHFYKVNVRQKILFLTLFFLTGTLFAQTNGVITGKITDAETGEALIGVNVLLEGTLRGSASDIDGTYTIKAVPPGTYNIVATYIGFDKKRIENIKVTLNKTIDLNFTMSMEILEGKEVMVTAKADKNNETIMLKERKKAVAVTNAVSAEAISRAGSGNAADAMKQVTGASVVDGKYVYVRGLGDRYTSVQLNGAELPSVDPYKRAGAIDLIPANMVNNIVTVKSFTPDKPGDFSGGVVDVETKDFPDRLDISFSMSSSYNSQTTFSDKALSYNGSSSDWLGFDNGKRELPSLLNDGTYSVDAALAQKDMEAATSLNNVTKAFNDQMGLRTKTLPVNQNYAFSIGNQFNLFNKPLGYIASLTYKRNYQSYENGEYNNWWLGQSDATQQDLENVYSLSDHQSTDEVLWGANAKLSYEITPKHIISINGIYNQNGQSSSRYLTGSYPYDLPEDRMYQVTKLQYKQSSLKNVQAHGKHTFPGFLNSTINWQSSYSKVNQDEPDLRFFYNNYSLEDGVYRMKSNLPPERYFRYLDENQIENKIDIAIPFKQWAGENATFKFGGFLSYKDRDFTERRFVYNNYSSRNISSLNDVNGDLGLFFSEENLGLVGTRTTPDGRTFPSLGMYISEENKESSNYSGDQTISAGYAMFDLPLISKFRFIGGARFESTNLNVENKNKDLQKGSVSTNDILPSINMLYTLRQNINLRFAYTRTLARPTFREISSFQSYDFNGGSTYVGNADLQRSLIDNLDLRFELFDRPGELYSISLFYKNFDDPIELTIRTQESTDVTNVVYTWNNVDQAKVYGVEFELRKQLDVLSSKLKNFSLSGNVSFIHSAVDTDSTEFNGISAKRLDPDDQRPFQGQSPYLVNLTLGYDNFAKGLSGSIYYNIFGKRLAIVGLTGTPDAYEQPFGLLNASLAKELTKNIKLKISASNILDSESKKTLSFSGKEYIFTNFQRGRSIALGVSYSY